MRPTTPRSGGNAIPVGAHVFDRNNDKVGTVLQLEADYFVAEKGWLFTQDVYIPLDAVSTVNADGVYLRYTKAELQDQDWTNPPTAAAPEPAVGRATTVTSTTAATTTGQTDIRVPLREEELVVDKTRQQEGSVHLHKDVVTEQQSVTVPVTHEEVHIEHVAADPNTPVAADAFVERDIDVPVMGEQVTTDKIVRATDEVRVRKEAVTEQEQVSDTVRKERLQVERNGTTGIRDGDTGGDRSESRR